MHGAGFGLSQRDMQVPGPPRWGAYGAPADQAYQQYGGVPPRQMQQGGAMPPGGMRWRPGGMQPSMQHFNPAPGPPPGKVRSLGRRAGRQHKGLCHALAGWLLLVCSRPNLLQPASLGALFAACPILPLCWTPLFPHCRAAAGTCRTARARRAAAAA